MSNKWKRVNEDTERLKVGGGWTYMRTAEGNTHTWFVPDEKPADEKAEPTPPSQLTRELPEDAFRPRIPDGPTPGLMPEENIPGSSRSYDPDNFPGRFGGYGQVKSAAPMGGRQVEGRWGIGRPPIVGPNMSDADAIAHVYGDQARAAAAERDVPVEQVLKELEIEAQKRIAGDKKASGHHSKSKSED